MRIGIDLGGSKIEIAVLDAQGAERLRRRVATPAGRYESIVQALADLVAEAERDCGARCSVGVGMPGSISPRSGLVRNSNTVCLNGRPLREDLAAALGREVRLANDADCFTLSEAVDGAARDADPVFGVILGTGVGGGLVSGGRLHAGCNGIAGEWGHNPLAAVSPAELPGAACYCGRYGCVETWLCGPALAREYAALGGESLDAAAIGARAAAGEILAESVLRQYEARLARALAVAINIFDPAVIVLGGGLSKLARLYRNVPDLWVPHVFADAVSTRLLAPVHGDASGVRGAAWLWPQ